MLLMEPVVFPPRISCQAIRMETGQDVLMGEDDERLDSDPIETAFPGL